MNVLSEHRVLDLRLQDIGQQQIGNGLQAVAGRRVSGNFDPEHSQLFDEPPYFRAAGPNLVSDFRPADYYGGVVHEKPDDPSQTNIGFLR